MGMNTPGYDFAKEHGYVLHSYSGDNTRATYMKDGVSLTVWSDGQGELFTVNGLVYCTTLKFSLYHVNFSMFEKAIAAFVEEIE